MECKYAYLERNIEYVLCKKEPRPNRYDRTALFHAVCAHQVHCPKLNCHKLNSTWVNCTKLAERPQDGAGAHFEESVSVPAEEPKKRTRTRRKPESED